ncbi:MAG: vanadium-dependent haloperoxidase [Bacteroidota bacterium]
MMSCIQMIKRLGGITSLLFLLNLSFLQAQTDHSVARQWNEVLLEAIRMDFARPTVHARNLYHISTAMYDAWAAYEEDAQPFFLGNEVGGVIFPFGEIDPSLVGDKQAMQEEAISYAAYRLIIHRFLSETRGIGTLVNAAQLMESLGYDTAYYKVDYQSGRGAALGNYLAAQIISFGLKDGSNEANDYANKYYQPVNPPTEIENFGIWGISDPNRWQPLAFEFFIDQSGNMGGSVPDFLSPEWGNVLPFAMTEADRVVREREGDAYQVYHDPGPPPYLSFEGGPGMDNYRWGFTLVLKWSRHLSPDDGVMWDISPASIGNISPEDFPDKFEDYPSFYKEEEGGDIGLGHDLNPVTGQPYEPNLVPRGDYTRVLAEFWADGPDSETPPGHWFTILNYVNDHPMLEKRFEGQGPVLDDLEWDVKSYFALGGAMHDAAIAAWSVKGYYDYVRPVTAIRFMSDIGQASEVDSPFYHPSGLKLEPGFTELVRDGDSIKEVFPWIDFLMKSYVWRGPGQIPNPSVDEAGVGWINTNGWWPYQRPTFITPPFAGYVSGHSTYSRAAAEVLTRLTGDPFFPGGMGVFKAEQNRFLVFEEGPSVDVNLQWATYRDASDQCSLSRIWGGIHPPADDIPGRKMGIVVGNRAFDKAKTYMENTAVGGFSLDGFQVWPVPAQTDLQVNIWIDRPLTDGVLKVVDLQGRILISRDLGTMEAQQFIQFVPPVNGNQVLVVKVSGKEWEQTRKIVFQ